MTNNKNSMVIAIAAVIIIGGMVSVGYKMFEHNSRVVEQFTSIDVPDNEESFGDWIKYTGSNPCPGLVEQRFDANKSHYMCMYQK